MTQDMITLGFDRIIEQLQEQAVSQAAKRKLAETEPILNEGLCKARMEETTAALHVMKNAGSPPLAEMEEVEKSLSEAAQGGMLLPEQLSGVARFCVTVRRMRWYLQSAAQLNAGIASWQTELPDVHALEEEIDVSVREDTVLDDASPTLRSLRRQRERAEQEIREKLNQVLLHHREKLADSYITQRNGAYVLPVQKRFQSAFPGRAVDASAKGNTVFMEPTAVQALRQTLDGLLTDIETEERRIL